MNAPDTAQQFKRPKPKGINKWARKVRHPINRFLSSQSLIGEQPVFDADVLPQLAAISENFEAMRAEAKALLKEREEIPSFGEISPDHRRIAKDEKWKSLFLHGYSYDSAKNGAKVPSIAAAIKDTPGLITALLSIMEPRTHVPRHRGLTKGWLNCHLALSVPKEGRCEIAIDDELYQWREGEWLIFDETFHHEVWNDSDEPRLVLFLQVKRPMKWRGRLLSSAIYQAIRSSSFVQDVRKKLS